MARRPSPAGPGPTAALPAVDRDANAPVHVVRPDDAVIERDAQIGTYYNAVKPDLAADRQLRAQVQLMFPK